MLEVVQLNYETCPSVQAIADVRAALRADTLAQYGTPSVQLSAGGTLRLVDDEPLCYERLSAHL